MTDKKFTPGQVEKLAGLIDYQAGSVVSKMLMKKPNGMVM